MKFHIEKSQRVYIRVFKLENLKENIFILSLSFFPYLTLSLSFSLSEIISPTPDPTSIRPDSTIPTGGKTTRSQPRWPVARSGGASIERRALAHSLRARAARLSHPVPAQHQPAVRLIDLNRPRTKHTRGIPSAHRDAQGTAQAAIHADQLGQPKPVASRPRPVTNRV